MVQNIVIWILCHISHPYSWIFFWIRNNEKKMNANKCQDNIKYVDLGVSVAIDLTKANKYVIQHKLITANIKSELNIKKVNLLR